VACIPATSALSQNARISRSNPGKSTLGSTFSNAIGCSWGGNKSPDRTPGTICDNLTEAISSPTARRAVPCVQRRLSRAEATWINCDATRIAYGATESGVIWTARAASYPARRSSSSCRQECPDGRNDIARFRVSIAVAVTPDMR